VKKKRFSEEQIIAVLKEAEAGAKVLDLCRKHGISEGQVRRHDRGRSTTVEGAGSRRTPSSSASLPTRRSITQR